MKAIELQAVITSISSRQDRSARFSTETPELSDEEFTEFRRLQGQNVRIILTPTDETPEDIMQVEEDLDAKPRHIRLRNSLYVPWEAKLQKKYPDFDTFYRVTMDKLIEDIKAKIL